MITLKSMALGSTSSLLIVASVVLYDYQLLALGLLLLSFVAVTQLLKVELRITRRLSTDRILEGERIKVVTTVVNRGKRETLVVLYDTLPDKVRVVHGSNKQVIVLKPGAKTRMRYSIECPRRGHFSIGPLKHRRRDFFNLFYEEDEVKGDSYFSVYPKFETIDHFPVKSYQSSYFEMLPLKTVGAGYEFFCIRDYIIGDSPRRINWKASARHQKWMVNEYEMENMNDAMIIVDARAISGVGSAVNNPLEHSIKAAASITSWLLRGRNQVGMIVFGSENNSRVVPPAPGSNQLDIVTSALVSVEAEGNEPFKAALDKAKPYMTPLTAIILISSLDREDTVVEAARDIMGMNKFFIITLSSPDIERVVSGNYTSKYTMLMLEKETMLEELRFFGAKCVLWNPENPLKAALPGLI